MGWEDRPYYRDRPSGMGGRLAWLLTGSVPLGTWFGIRVRAHASLLILAVLTVLFPQTMGNAYGSLSFLTVLFVVVLLHEFGHCLASRSVGGDPRDIVLTPLGGLALADAPRRPWATFWTVLGGPLVNVIICLVCVLVLALMGGGWGALAGLPWNLFHISIPSMSKLWALTEHSQIAWWTLWTFDISYALLLFNLLPIFPLDGGQLLQSLLWVRIGYYKSMKFACVTGIIGAVVLALLGIATRRMLLVFIALSGLWMCVQMRAQVEAEGPDDWQDSVDYGASARARPAKERGPSRWATWRASREVAARDEEQQSVDRILQKVHDSGMNSLTAGERRTLARATENQRRRDGASGRKRG